MRILVTGGAGFIGSHLSLRLFDEGHHVGVQRGLGIAAALGARRDRAGLPLEAGEERGIGRARRMQVASPERQHAVMIEAVENHMPEVIVIDEIGTTAEALAARTIADSIVADGGGRTLYVFERDHGRRGGRRGACDCRPPRPRARPHEAHRGARQRGARSHQGITLSFLSGVQLELLVADAHVGREAAAQVGQRVEGAVQVGRAVDQDEARPRRRSFF